MYIELEGVGGTTVCRGLLDGVVVVEFESPLLTGVLCFCKSGGLTLCSDLVVGRTGVNGDTEMAVMEAE